MSDVETLLNTVSDEIESKTNESETKPKICEAVHTPDSANQTSSPIEAKDDADGMHPTDSNPSTEQLAAAADEDATTDCNANEQPGASSVEARELPNFHNLQTRIDTLMASAVTQAHAPTVESLENLQSIVDRFERSFGQFRQETETAIADCRREFNDIRRKFEMLKRIRHSLFIEFVSRRASRLLEGETDGPPEPKRKRWGKKSSIRRR